MGGGGAMGTGVGGARGGTNADPAIDIGYAGHAGIVAWT